MNKSSIIKKTVFITVVLLLNIFSACSDKAEPKATLPEVQETRKEKPPEVKPPTVQESPAKIEEIKAEEIAKPYIISSTPQNTELKFNNTETKKTVPDAVYNIQEPKPAIGKKTEDPDKIRFQKLDDVTYSISSILPGNKSLIMLFNMKEWGTWNMGSWYVSDGVTNKTDKAVFLAGGGSDMEYVFRAAPEDNMPCRLTGGYHGAEKLKSLNFFNEDGRELKLKNGERVVLGKLKIIETTSIYFDDSYTRSYADVVRVYSYSPGKVEFSGDFKFTCDTYMRTSYVCMFPVSKKFGNHVRFNGSGNVYDTPKHGTTLTANGNENYIGYEKTLSVDIWGDENPKYVFNVSIGDEAMVDGFSNNLKVFYWDANVGGNKLYFSKFNQDKSTKVEAGTEWKSYAVWRLNASE